jgi:hypothetical protein
VLSGGGLGVLARIALIDESDFDARFGCGLDGLGDAADLGAIVGVGGRAMQDQQMPERVDGQQLLALGPVIAGSCSAFRGRAQCAAVDDRSARLPAASRGEPQHNAQILRQGLEASGAQPALRLLVDDLPGRKVVGRPALGRARLDDVAQTVEHPRAANEPVAPIVLEEA